MWLIGPRGTPGDGRNIVGPKGEPGLPGKKQALYNFANQLNFVK